MTAPVTTDLAARVDNGVKIYRQDHNISPLPFWRESEAPDRQGRQRKGLAYRGNFFDLNVYLYLHICGTE